MAKDKKRVKSKLQTKTVRATIDKNLARALSLTHIKEVGSYSLDNVFVNVGSKEIVATDKCTLLVITPKPFGLLPSLLLNLEGGFYDVVGNVLLRKDIEMKDVHFPDYQNVIPLADKQVCEDYILRGIIYCMAKNQVAVDIWKYESVLKVLNNFAPDNWMFFNNSPVAPVLMLYDGREYNVKYVIMPINMG